METKFESGRHREVTGRRGRVVGILKGARSFVTRGTIVYKPSRFMILPGAIVFRRVKFNLSVDLDIFLPISTNHFFQP